MDLPLLKAIINNSCGTPLTIRIQNPSSTDKGPKSGVWDSLKLGEFFNCFS